MALIQEILSHRIRFLKTCILYLSFIVLGLSMAILGPTLLDLRALINASALQINYIFPVGSIGYLAGSVIGGVIYDRFDSQLTLALFLIIISITEALIPWNRTLIGLAITNFILSFGGGGLDTSANVWCLHLWGKSSAPFMQALHFSFGVGAFVAPLIAEPFLIPFKTNGTEVVDHIEAVDTSDIDIWWAYAIISIVSLVSFSCLIVMYLVKSSDKAHPTIENDHNINKLSLKHKIIILTFAALFFHCYCGLEIAFGRYTTSFAFYCDLHLDKSIGAFMTSLFWGSFTLFRLMAIFIVDIIGTRIMIWSDIAVILIGNIVILIFGNTYETGLWIGVALMGIGTSSIFPTMFSFIEEFMPVTSGIGSLFLVVSCLGEFTIPFIVGYYIETVPMVLIYVTTFAGIACFIFFAILCFISKVFNKIFL